MSLPKVNLASLQPRTGPNKFAVQFGLDRCHPSPTSIAAPENVSLAGETSAAAMAPARFTSAAELAFPSVASVPLRT